MKHNNAFTLAEVLFALFVLTVSVYVFSSLQFKSIMRTEKSGHEIKRVFFIKKYLYKLYSNTKKLKKNKSMKITIEKPSTIITAHNQEINKKSTLKDFSKEIDIIWSQGDWEQGPHKRSLKMISLIPKQIDEK